MSQRERELLWQRKYNDVYRQHYNLAVSCTQCTHSYHDLWVMVVYYTTQHSVIIFHGWQQHEEKEKREIRATLFWVLKKRKKVKKKKENKLAVLLLAGVFSIFECWTFRFWSWDKRSTFLSPTQGKMQLSSLFLPFFVNLNSGLSQKNLQWTNFDSNLGE